MSDSPATGEGKPERKGGWRPSPFSLLGWVMGGLSLLNLIEALSPLKILGTLKIWLDAYTSIVNVVSTFLFGWIDHSWIGIDQLEIHVLVIATILVSAYVRADLREKRSKGSEFFPAIARTFTLATFFISFIFLPALLYQPGSGWHVAAIATGTVGVLLLLPRSESEGAGYPLPPVRSFLKELAGVVAVCLILVTLNYTLFQYLMPK